MYTYQFFFFLVSLLFFFKSRDVVQSWVSNSLCQLLEFLWNLWFCPLFLLPPRIWPYLPSGPQFFSKDIFSFLSLPNVAGFRELQVRFPAQRKLWHIARDQEPTLLPPGSELCCSDLLGLESSVPLSSSAATSVRHISVTAEHSIKAHGYF